MDVLLGDRARVSTVDWRLGHLRLLERVGGGRQGSTF
jgi:hypothetical protein